MAREIYWIVDTRYDMHEGTDSFARKRGIRIWLKPERISVQLMEESRGTSGFDKEGKRSHLIAPGIVEPRLHITAATS